MQVVDTIAELRALLARRSGIAVVPTMGNLHAGHIALVREARRRAPIVVTTLFVNRLQFGPREDFDRYPRTMANDCAQLASVGCDYVFAPDEREMYPSPQTCHVEPSPVLADILEGAFRPGFFRGVATVVLKLFNIVQPQVALFGRKDYQQLRIIEHMVRELALPIEIVPCDTMRDTDGLALSSRNGYLSDPERAEASRLHAILVAVRDAVARGGDIAVEQAGALARLTDRGWTPDYVEVRRQSDLLIPTPADRDLVVLAAARLGRTRLIDNVEFVRT